jgi:A49-like RNA polymerase I associated factor
MSSEKRKAADAWTEATLIKDDDRRAIYLASFSGVIPPPETTFREFKRIRKDRKDENDVILQGETERIEFEGRTKSKDNDDNCQYALRCIFGLMVDMRFVFITPTRSR